MEFVLLLFFEKSRALWKFIISFKQTHKRRGNPRNMEGNTCPAPADKQSVTQILVVGRWQKPQENFVKYEYNFYFH